MSNLIVHGVLCWVGLGVGLYTFIRHLNGFNKDSTPPADAWLIMVGMLLWSVVGYRGLIEGVSDMDLFASGLLLILWVGFTLQIRQHCLRLRLKLRRQTK